MNNDIFLIEQDDIVSAQAICNSIEDDGTRNRAMANVVAANIVKGYFQDFEVDIASGIHNIPYVLSRVDISDVYIRGNYIDVRVYFNENELCVPKAHFDLGITPIAYMFVKLDSELTEGKVTGFVLPSDINAGSYSDYIPIKEASLKSFYDIEPSISTLDDEDITPEFKISVFEFLDGKLEDEKSFFKILTTSGIAREYLSNTAKAKELFSSMLSEESDEDSEPSEGFEDLMIDEALNMDGDTIEELSELDDSEEFMPLDSDGMDELNEQEELFDDELTGESDLHEPEDDVDILGNVEQIEEFGDAVESNEQEELSGENNFDDSEYDEIEELQEDNAAENYEEIPQANDEDADIQPIEDNEFEELSEFDYATEISPSISTIEAGEDTEPDELAAEEPQEYDEYSESQAESEADKNSEQIENLFDGSTQDAVNVPEKRRKSFLPFLAVLVAIGAAGYFGYTKFANPVEPIDNVLETSLNTEKVGASKPIDENKTEAMPLETVENIQTIKPTEEAAAVSIPAIEKNLNASIEVSNLTVNWEVPTEYARNITAKRYLVKIGKILQLNLKTELLFLSTPPITNKISVELEYDAGRSKFVIKNVLDSSGVSNVDAVVKDTISRALDMNMNINMSVFNNLQGNPVLVIKL